MPPTDSRALEAPKHWCETCEGTGEVYQEHQAGCWVGGDFPCPDCDGKGYWVPRAALSAAPQSDGWMPIAEAPKDGTSVLVNDTTGLCPPCMSHWLEGEEWSGWVYDEELASDSNPLGPQPTHFMHIGPIPTTQTEGQSHGE